MSNIHPDADRSNHSHHHVKINVSEKVGESVFNPEIHAQTLYQVSMVLPGPKPKVIS